MKLRDLDDSGDLSLDRNDLVEVEGDEVTDARAGLEVMLFVSHTLCGYPRSIRSRNEPSTAGRGLRNVTVLQLALGATPPVGDRWGLDSGRCEVVF